MAVGTHPAAGQGHAMDRAATGENEIGRDKAAPGSAHPFSTTRGPRVRLPWTCDAIRPSNAGHHLAKAIEVERDHGHGFLWYALFFALGAALWRAFPQDPGLWPAIACTAICGLLAWWIENVRWRCAFGLLAVALAGFCAAELEAIRRAHIVLDSPVVTNITGVVESREIDFHGNWRYTIAVTATEDPTLGRPPDRVRVLARSGHAPIAIGDRIRGLARLSPPSGPAMPGTFDFSFNAYFSGLGAYGFFYGPPDNLGPAQREPPLNEKAARAVRELRETIAFRIREVLPGDAGAVAAAMTVSDRRAISEETEEAFRITGLAHILSISGLHMSLAAGIMFQGLRLVLSLSPRLVQSFPVKKLAAGGAILSSTFYLLISGAVVPAQRAWIMVLIMLLAVLLDRPALTLRNVAIAAIVILIVAPSAVTSPGFQMSFAATAALIAGYGAWSRRPQPELVPDPAERGRWLRHLGLFIGGMAMTSVIAGLATGIFSAHHFHRMASFGLFANIVAMPLISAIVMPAAVAALLAMPFGLDYLPLAIMGWGLDMVIAIAHGIAGFGGDVATGQVPLAVTALFTAALVIAVFSRTWLCLAAMAPAVAAILLLLFAPFDRPDVLIAEDGRLVAIVRDGVLATNRAQPPSFLFEQWQAAMRSAVHQPPVEKPAGIEGTPVSPMVESGSGRRAFDAVVWPDYPVLRTELEASMAQLDAAAGQGSFICWDGLWCLARPAGIGLIAVVEEPAFIGAACDLASVVVTSARSR